MSAQTYGLRSMRKQRFLTRTAVCLNAPLALLNVALNAALTTPSAFQVPVSPAPFTPRKGETPFRSFTSTGETRSLQMRPPRSRRAIRPACLSAPIIGAICQRPAARGLPGALRKEMRPSPLRLRPSALSSLAVGLRPPRIVFTISEQHLSNSPLLPIASPASPLHT